MNWNCCVKPPDEKVRDPIQGELFLTGTTKSPADARAPEAVPNAIDAGCPDTGGRAVEPAT